LLLRLCGLATVESVHTSFLIEAPILVAVVLGSSGKSPQHLAEVRIERIVQHGLSPFLRFDIRLNGCATGVFAQMKNPSGELGFVEKL
jgi:hypothetical protein